MRRTDILHSIGVLNEALISNDIVDALRNLLVTSGDGAKMSILPQLNAYSIRATRFDEDTRKLARIFDLEALADAAMWEQILDTKRGLDTTRGPIAHVLYTDVNNALRVLPKFAELLRQKGASEYLDVMPQGQRAEEEVGTVSVILLESEKEFSKPERLIELLQSVTELYQGLARMLNESPDSLTVLSCDSGSDKSFDFLGAAKVVEQFKELVVALWDRVVFFGPKQQEAKLNVIIKSLPVLERISELEASAHLGPELAEIIRRQIEGGIRKFVHAGAIIPEIREHTYHEPRALMSPEKKLLMPPPPPDKPASSPPENSDSDGDPKAAMMKEMLARLEKMELQQSGGTAGTNPAKRRVKKNI